MPRNKPKPVYKVKSVMPVNMQTKVKSIVNKQIAKKDAEDPRIFRDTYGPGVQNNTGNVISSFCTGITQGTNDNQRSGGQILVTGLQLRGEFYLPSDQTSANQVDQFRFIVFVDRQCNGTAPTVASVLETANLYSFYNEDNIPVGGKGRFKILWDKMLILATKTQSHDAGGNVRTSPVRIPIKKNFKLKVPIIYNSTLGNLTEMNLNNIGAICINGQGVSGIDLRWRTLFISKTV